MTCSVRINTFWWVFIGVDGYTKWYSVGMEDFSIVEISQTHRKA